MIVDKISQNFTFLQIYACPGGGELHLLAPTLSVTLRVLSCCRYTDAAAVRDRLRTLQERMEELTTAAAALEAPAPRNLRLGQRVIHMNHGYRGVICG